MADGHLNICKICVKARVAKHRVDNIERVREYDNSRCSHYRKRNTEKFKAHNALNNAVRAGKIVKPSVCQTCGAHTTIQGHHWSYLKEHWLDVQWLCQACHSKEHLRLREEGNMID
jgi:hypothetical protein